MLYKRRSCLLSTSGLFLLRCRLPYLLSVCLSICRLSLSLFFLFLFALQLSCDGQIGSFFPRSQSLFPPSLQSSFPFSNALSNQTSNVNVDSTTDFPVAPCFLARYSKPFSVSYRRVVNDNYHTDCLSICRLTHWSILFPSTIDLSSRKCSIIIRNINGLILRRNI